jgi:hypothetical protein
MEQILTKWVRISLSTAVGRWSQSATVAYIVIKILYWSAVKFENPSPQWIFPGIRPKSAGTWNLFIVFCIIMREFCDKISSLTQIVFTIHFAMPKNRQCIGSTVINRIGSKYDNLNNSDHLTLVCFTNYFLTESELHRRQPKAFSRCLAELRVINHSSILSIPAKLLWWFS